MTMVKGSKLETRNRKIGKTVEEKERTERRIAKMLPTREKGTRMLNPRRRVLLMIGNLLTLVEKRERKIAETPLRER